MPESEEPQLGLGTGHRVVKVRASGASASLVLSLSQATAAPALSHQAFLEAGPLGCQLPGCGRNGGTERAQTCSGVWSWSGPHGGDRLWKVAPPRGDCARWRLSHLSSLPSLYSSWGCKSQRTPARMGWDSPLVSS